MSHLDDLHNGCPGNVWERYISSLASSVEMRRQITRQPAHGSGPQHQVLLRLSTMLCPRLQQVLYHLTCTQQHLSSHIHARWAWKGDRGSSAKSWSDGQITTINIQILCTRIPSALPGPCDMLWAGHRFGQSFLGNLTSSSIFLVCATLSCVWHTCCHQLMKGNAGLAHLDNCIAMVQVVPNLQLELMHQSLTYNLRA